jgi:ankyrin repeat protein
MVIGAKNLIKQTGVDVNTKDEYGRSALFYANSLHTIAMLLGQGADVNIIDKFGNNVLHI